MAASSDSPASIITAVEVWECRVPLPVPLELGPEPMTSRDYTIVRIQDDAGKEGVSWGYSRGADVASTVRRNFRPQLLGKNGTPRKELWQSLYQSNPWVNQGGVFLRALSLCDIALWQLWSARSEASLETLLNAAKSDLPITVACCYPTKNKKPEEDAAEAGRFASRGYQSIKMCAADGGSLDTARLQAIREAIGPNIELKVDLHWLWSCEDDAKAVLSDWEELDLTWIEDAFPPESLSEMKKLKSLTNVAIAYGDDQNGRFYFDQLIRSGAVDVLRLDATVVGGLTEFLHVGRKANDQGITVSAHLFEEFHEAALGALTNSTNIERFEAESGLDGIDRLRQLTTEGCSWDWTAVEKYRLPEPRTGV